MSIPKDYRGNPIEIGDTIVYASAQYAEFLTVKVTRITAKSVQVGETRWGGKQFRKFAQVLVVEKGGMQ